jgi:hypothetical protein
VAGVDYRARPGWAYNLRAITCYDQSVDGLRQQGVTWQIVLNTLPSQAGVGGQRPCQMAP